MNNLSNQMSNLFDGNNQDKSLERYIRSLSPEAIAQLSRPEPDVANLMERNIVGSLGALPGQNFDVAITTSRESLAQLLASAMMHGYFLRNAQQRMTLEKALPALVGASDSSDESAN
ncbi:MAG TPA: DUF760 domain-containing protein [Elainellaceae cyanobacterium]|jgi:hypothetical protein